MTKPRNKHQDKAIPKSLHTISVIIAIAQDMRDRGHPPRIGVRTALKMLGLNGRPDPDGLAAKALELMKARAAK